VRRSKESVVDTTASDAKFFEGEDVVDNDVLAE